MKKSLFLLLVLLLTGCSSTWHVSTAGHDPIYSIEGSDAEIVVINNEFELQRLLRTDFNFRFDFAQYALSQPVSFDWNNRILGNRYNRYNPYWGYGYYWNRDQMWNDWVWGYPFNYGIGYTYSWRNRRWSSNQWGWNNYYGWNNYGWNSYYNNWGWRNQMNNYAWQNRYRSNTVYVNGRRGSTISVRNRIGQAAMIESTKRRVNTKPRVYVRPENNNNNTRINKPRINNPRPTINNNSRPRINNTPRPTPTIRTTPRTSTRSNNARTVRSNSRRKN